MVETALFLLVFFGFVFLIVDVSWAMFTKLTLQHAVCSGVRYAITSQTMTTSGGTQLGQIDSIKQAVKSSAMGVLSDADLSSYVTVTFYPASDLSKPVTGIGANSAGNLVVVSVNAWPFSPIAPLLHSSAPILINASSGDLIESSGSGQIPPPL